ncbi:hypothetical protein A2W24_07090 [Microgenomates group bacterium RBG_16_45_19]|nr:MAG: hypothetical protein A2W24_07090 [Microgenomates group bacterium RBG_16_45_19]
MNLSVGIVGLANVGKSTLFNALLQKQQALVANYPFATIEPNIGIVPVPDERLDRLAETIAKERVHPEGRGVNKEILMKVKLPPVVPATVKFIDIAGLVKGASTGEGLGNQFLAQIREVNVICHIIRTFEDEAVVRQGSVSPKDDWEMVNTELALADLETKQKRETKKKGITEALPLLTEKPVIVVVNVNEGQEKQAETVARGLGIEPRWVVGISAKMEADLAALPPAEQREYLATQGLKQSGLEKLIQLAYERLELISFLTAGEKEVRAWTLRRGDTALRASSVIHTDFARKFIKAEVIPWQELVKCGGWKRAKETGAVRSEGRDYVIQDGEVVEFKIGA